MHPTSAPYTIPRRTDMARSARRTFLKWSGAGPIAARMGATVRSLRRGRGHKEVLPAGETALAIKLTPESSNSAAIQQRYVERVVDVSAIAEEIRGAQRKPVVASVK